jgi:hypothetical protein
MADRPLELRNVNWSDCCNCTRIFRAFRMAIQPSKLGLALLGVLLTFLWGWTLDGVWSQKQSPLPGELEANWQVSDLTAWREAMETARLSRLQGLHVSLPTPMPADLAKRLKDRPDAAVDALEKELEAQYHKETQSATLEEKATRSREYNLHYLQAEGLRPRGIFSSYVAYETRVIQQAMDAATSLNITSGLREALDARRDVGDPAHLERPEPTGLLASIVLMLRGKQWLITQHFVFSCFLGIGMLLIWALIGGAICRSAALNFSREESIPPRASLGFSVQKYLGFFTAPLLPIGMILLIGILLFLGGIFMSIPYLGELIGTFLMPIGLIGGFVITLVLIGFMAGGSLFYPTIAVEGSDSFDAMSRSYSYVFSKPWRAIFYALLAFVYGALCFLFVRFFALLMLKSTRFFISSGTFMTSRPGTGYSGADKLEAMWTNPTFEHLWRPPAPFGMIRWESLGAWFITVWVTIVIALLIAFVVSFYYSASTIIYFLLRREVDATDFEDVFLEDDGLEASTVAAGAFAGTPSTPPAKSSAPPPPPPPISPEPEAPPSTES